MPDDDLRHLTRARLFLLNPLLDSNTCLGIPFLPQQPPLQVIAIRILADPKYYADSAMFRLQKMDFPISLKNSHKITASGFLQIFFLAPRRFFWVPENLLWSEFAEPISRCHPAIHEKVAAGDKCAFGTHEKRAHRSYLIGCASASSRA